MRVPTPRQLALGVDLAAVLVAGSVAVTLAGLTWHLLGHTGDRGRVVAAVSPAAAAPLDLTPVTQFAPFGVAVAGPAPGVAGDPPRSACSCAASCWRDRRALPRP